MERFRAEVRRIPPTMRARMVDRSWREDPACPPFDALALLTLAYLDPGGVVRAGELVVAASVADDVVHVFERLFAARFPIARMEPIDVFDGDDDRSMAANNTSGFNFRRIAGSDRLSHHALGVAVDVNPRWNPMILRGVVHPPAAVDCLDRSDVRPGMIVRPGVVVDAFESRGWYWGGEWEDLPDYHHFSQLPRG